MDIRKRIDVFWPYLHAIPEPAFREMKTSAFVAEVLRKAGYEVQEKVGGTTGVVCAVIWTACFSNRKTERKKRCMPAVTTGI